MGNKEQKRGYDGCRLQMGRINNESDPPHSGVKKSLQAKHHIKHKGSEKRKQSNRTKAEEKNKSVPEKTEEGGKRAPRAMEVREEGVTGGMIQIARAHDGTFS
jgi:hypothetical protein